MEECTFCKIVKGELPAHKIYEDKDHLAFLDIYPVTKGMTVVIPKKHHYGYVFDMPDKNFIKLYLFTKKVTEVLKKTLKPIWIFQVMEGLMIDHAHLKLFPIYKMKVRIPRKRVYFKEYLGYIDTHLGPSADDKELAQLTEKISKKASKLK